MLVNTFLHIPGVGDKTERKLWRNQIHSWHDFLQAEQKIPLSSGKQEKVNQHVQQSLDYYQEGNYRSLIDQFPSRIHWRTYRELKERGKCCFLDIETTGLDKQRHDVTVVGLYDGQESKMFVQGKNLDQFLPEIRQYDLIVTYNGKCFDLPFLRHKFPQLKRNFFHADLRYKLKKIGYTGGLKAIEKEFGISREEDVKGMDGYEAVRLWKQYQKGNKKALRLLIDYNREDIENLEVLMDAAYSQLRQRKFSPKPRG